MPSTEGVPHKNQIPLRVRKRSPMEQEGIDHTEMPEDAFDSGWARMAAEERRPDGAAGYRTSGSASG